MDKLKPCPFCGGEAILRIGDRCVWVECECCGAKSALHSALNSHAVTAITMVYTKWNRRGDHPVAAPDTPARGKCSSCAYYHKDTCFCTLGEDYTGPDCPACSDFQGYAPKEGATTDG